jgi:predicted nucleic acid-binding protein
MPTVSNTSPLLNLAIIGRLNLVRAQFGSVLVPPAVVEECRLEEGRPGSSALRQAIEKGWIVEKKPSDDPLISTLGQDLDLGESEAITLAVEKEASLILLDEREGRRRARAVGLEVTGALGILAQADRRGDLDSLSDALDRLEGEAGFWIGSALREQILGGPE